MAHYMSTPELEARIQEINDRMWEMQETYSGCDWCCGGGDDEMANHKDELAELTLEKYKRLLEKRYKLYKECLPHNWYEFGDAEWDALTQQMVEIIQNEYVGNLQDYVVADYDHDFLVRSWNGGPSYEMIYYRDRGMRNAHRKLRIKIKKNPGRIHSFIRGTIRESHTSN